MATPTNFRERSALLSQLLQQGGAKPGEKANTSAGTSTETSAKTNTAGAAGASGERGETGDRDYLIHNAFMFPQESVVEMKSFVAKMKVLGKKQTTASKTILYTFDEPITKENPTGILIQIELDQADKFKSKHVIYRSRQDGVVASDLINKNVLPSITDRDLYDVVQKSFSQQTSNDPVFVQKLKNICERNDDTGSVENTAIGKLYKIRIPNANVYMDFVVDAKGEIIHKNVVYKVTNFESPEKLLTYQNEIIKTAVAAFGKTRVRRFLNIADQKYGRTRGLQKLLKATPSVVLFV
jgi:hypothetical protein